MIDQLSSPEGWLSGAAGVAAVTLYFTALGILSLFGLHRLWLLHVVWRRRAAGEGGPGQAGGSGLPHVTVQCPVYNEPDVAVRLLDAACALEHPRQLLEIQVLDDSDDETTALLEARAAQHRARGLDVSVVRRSTREGYKAGALEHGLAVAKGELVAIFDADFVPQPDFLRRVLPAFEDEGVGLVQAAWGHLNRDSSWLTRVQALMLDGHFQVEHAARNRAGRFFNFNGTAGVFRRSCIEEAGGWQHDTLTEDLDLSYRAQLAGWRFVFLEDVIAPAELPVEVNAWKGQQRRWTTGAVQTARKVLPRVLRAGLPWRTKLEAVLHLTANAAYPLLVVLCLTTLPAAAARRAWGWGPLVWAELPILLLTTGVLAAFYGLAARRAGGRARWWTLPQLLAVGVGASINNTRAVLAGLRREVGEFVRTPKTGDAGPARRKTRGRYRMGADAWARVETLFGAVLLAEAALAAVAGFWATVPFLGLFAGGFLAVGMGSLDRRTA
jgi:cellulose synthase/poly-beta-1,6-N-acetylglucosamine synthase-like glycosyltransferase